MFCLQCSLTEHWFLSTFFAKQETSRGDESWTLAWGYKQGRLYPAARTGREPLGASHFTRFSRKEGWPLRWSPLTVSQGFGFYWAHSLGWQHSRIEEAGKQAFAPFPSASRDDCVASGAPGGVGFQRPVRMVAWSPVSPHRPGSAQSDSSQGSGGSAWSRPMRGAGPHTGNRP